MQEVRELISTRKPGVVESDILATEMMLHSRFPIKYRELIKLVNNAVIGEWILYPLKDSQRIQKTFDDIVRNNKETELPSEYIAFAEDGTGDLLCFRTVEGTMLESIYLWSHEEGTVDEFFQDIEQMILDLQQ